MSSVTVTLNTVILFSSVGLKIEDGTLIMSVHHVLLRLKAAEECFRQAKEKASYSVKPKHASGIVSSHLTQSFVFI